MAELFASEPDQPSTPEAYRVLARKYRPSTFAELIGQEAMVRTLTNAIATNRLPQAWILTGVRGIGKTTTARIIARALNCTGVDGQGGPTIEPCGVCDACRAIAEDRHVDVLEMDAASRTGVDDIRDIIDGVRYGPASARYKIYILDEVHMLSKNAFNALLKTLEEPPPHTKFIFATTEIRKVPVTVLSRCQRFDLKRIDSEMLTRHFMNISAKEQVEAEEEAIRLIAHAADGSVRDGLSLLDQAIARGKNKVSTDDVKDMLGLADRSQSLLLGRSLLKGSIKEALQAFDTLTEAGADPLQTMQDLCDLIHLLTRAQVIPDFIQRPDLSEADRQILTDLSDIKIPALSRAWQILLKGIEEVQRAPHPQTAAEMALIRLAYAADLPTPADLIRKLQNQQVSQSSEPVSPPSSPSGGGSLFARATVSGSGAAQVASFLTPDPVETNVPCPTSFAEVVAFIEDLREGTLIAQVRSFVHPVRCKAGLLEVRLEESASQDLCTRLASALSKGTGRPWMVSPSEEEGGPTLAEEEAAAEVAEQNRIQSHPLMQATLLTFPDATIMKITRKEVTALTGTTDDDKADMASSDADVEDEP